MERNRQLRPASVYMDGVGELLSVRGHMGLLELTGVRVRVRLLAGTLMVTGEGLYLAGMDAEDVTIVGKIACVTLERREGI